MRDITSHTRDVTKAFEIFAGLPKFITAVKHLPTHLEVPLMHLDQNFEREVERILSLLGRRA